MPANTSPKFLFIPVSSAEGIGEYMRSMIIADGVKRQWPNAEIHFVLSEQAPYSTQCPYTTHLVKHSPTKETIAVNQVIQAIKPHVVVFDASGRKSQLKCARSVGAKVIFISQHKRKRSRGMKIARMRYTDLHWVAQPEFAISSISRFDRLKLTICKMPLPQHIGMVFTPPATEKLPALLAQYQVTAGEFLLFNAGSGGHLVGDTLATDIFAKVAQAIAEQTGLACLLVVGANYPKAMPEIKGVRVISSLNNGDFINLINAAKLSVLSGGGTLLQAIALKKPVLSVPVAKDQAARVHASVVNGFATTVSCDVNAMTHAILGMLGSTELADLQNRLNLNPSTNGLMTAIDDIAGLLEELTI